MRGRKLICSAAGESRAYPRTSGPQRELLPEIGSLGQHFLKVKIIRIAPLRNSPRQNADLQRVAAEGIGLQGPEAKVKGEAVQGFETLRVDLQPFFVDKIYCRGISVKVHFQP